MEFDGDIDPEFVISGLLHDLDQAQMHALNTNEAVSLALHDLRSIEEVPLGDLVGYVDAIIETLKAAL